MIDEKKLNTDDLCDICSSADCTNCFSSEDFKKWIDSQPKAGEWIPVSEELPEEEYDTVLVFLESNIYDIAIWHSEYGFRPWYEGYFGKSTPDWKSEVLAWMPLPEPYKEQNDAI